MPTHDRTNILYVHSSDEMYGADIILLQLVEQLDPQVFRPIVVLPTDLPFDGKLSQALTALGVKCLHINLAVLRRSYFHPFRFPLFVWRLFYSLLTLIRLIRREQIDIVHSNTLAVIPSAVAAWLTRTPHVWHVHEIIGHPKFLWRLTSWLAAHLADRVVAVSGPTREHLCAGNKGNEKKSVVIHNGIDTKRFDVAFGTGQAIRKSWGVSSDQVLIGMIGRFSHWKGQNYLLTVAEEVLSQQTNVKFAFVGGTVPGQTNVFDEFRQQVADKKLEAQIIISSYRKDIPSVLDAYDIFVLPSTLPDPLPTVVLEAMAMAKPVVANAHGGSIEMVEHEVTGLLVQPDYSSEMANALTTLIENVNLRQAMGKKARQRLVTEFSLATFVERWTNLYTTLRRG